MENPYAGEWSRISRIANEVRQSRERVSRLEEEARALQAQAQNIPAQMDEDGNDMNASLRESMNAQAQDALQQLQSAREDLRESVSSAHSLARQYSQKRRAYEEKEGKTSKAGADFGKLAGFRFGSSTAAEGQRLAKQREKHYSDHVKVLSSLISAAEQAAEGVDPNQQNTSEIADRGTFQRPGNKSETGRNIAGAGAAASKESVRSNTSSGKSSGKSGRNLGRENQKHDTGEYFNAVLQSGDESLIQLAAALMVSPELLNSYAKDWNLHVQDNVEIDSSNEKKNMTYIYAGVKYKNPDMEKYKYNQVINPGPLSKYRNERGKIVDITTSFYGGRYNEEILQEDTVFYRVSSGNGIGHWFTSEPPDSIIQARINNAVPLTWVDSQGEFSGFSGIDTIYAFVVPKGTRIYTGPVRDQMGMSGGGPEHLQTFIPELDNIRLKDTYALEEVPGERTIFTDVMESGIRLVPRKGALVPDYLGVADVQKISLDDHIDPTALKPENMYVYNGNKYLTDRNGNIAYTDMSMSVVDFAQAIRKSHNEYKRTGGKNALHSNMDAGHIMAIKNGQHPSFTMEQERTTNRMGGAFRNFEMDMEKLSKEHKTVRVFGVYSEGDSSSGTYSPFWTYRAEVDGELLYEAVFTNDSSQSKG